MEYNERDVEHPQLIEFIKSHKDIKSVLDVGGFYSYQTYAQDMRNLVEKYHSLDVLYDPITEKVVDKYFTKNVLDHDGKYDLVTCISTIEHSGISSYKIENYSSERMKVFRKILSLSQKYVFITFPFGKESFEANEFANITSSQLEEFYSFSRRASARFYYSENPQMKYPFEEIPRYVAEKVPYNKSVGTRCVCIMEIQV